MDITIVIPTRNRFSYLKKAIESLRESVCQFPKILLIHDAPENRESLDWFSRFNDIENIEIKNKQSMAMLFNKAIVFSKTNWVFICNDDIIFKMGWFEYLSNTINIKNYKQINLYSYSAFAINKSLVPLLGWFDERFLGGYYEDVDWQLRIKESCLEDCVDYSHDFKFIEHVKATPMSQPEWPWKENVLWFCKKWGRSNFTNWNLPSFRQEPEVDWYPEYTKAYAKLFNLHIRINEINKNVRLGKAVYPTKDRT